MDDFCYCGYSFTTVLHPSQNYRTVQPPEPLSSDHFRIELYLRHETDLEIFDEHLSLVHVQRFRRPDIGPKFLYLSCKEVLSDEGPLLLKRDVFNYQCMPESLADTLTPEIMKFCRNLFDANEVLRSRKSDEDRPPHQPQPRCFILPFAIKMFILTLEVQIFEFVQEFRTIPASEEAIDESLKKVNFSEEGSGDESCAVCLDELRYEGVKMPCSHAYHRECIVRWLKRSNMCPQCRYQLP